MQTGGQVSSAPVLQGSRAGRECLAPEGSPRLTPTRASSASSSSFTFREVTRSSLPPDRRTCFSAQLCPPPPVHPRRSHTRKWAICLPQVPARRCWSRGAPLVQNLRRRVPDRRQTGGTSGRKKNSARVIYSTENARPIPSKSTGQALIRTHTHRITPRNSPTPTRGSTSRHVAVLEALSVWVVSGAFSCLSQTEKTNGAVCNPCAGGRTRRAGRPPARYSWPSLLS